MISLFSFIFTFLSRLSGGEQKVKSRWVAKVFLSRLSGGELY